MNKKSIAVALGLLAIFSSCSTDSEDGKGKTSVRMLTSFSDNEGNTYSDFKYDEQHRLLSFSKKAVQTIDDEIISSKQTHTSYTYFPDSIIKEITGDGTHIKGTYILTAGRVSKATINNSGYTELFLFSYNTNGQISQISGYEDGGKTIVSWDKGNIDNVTISYDGIDESNQIAYTYTDYPAKNFIAFEELGYAFPILYGVEPVLFKQGSYGEYPRNLVKTVNTADAYTCNYTINNQKDIIKFMDNRGKEGNFTWR